MKVRDDPIPVMEHSLVENKLHIIQFAKFYHRETVGVLNKRNLYIYLSSKSNCQSLNSCELKKSRLDTDRHGYD